MQPEPQSLTGAPAIRSVAGVLMGSVYWPAQSATAGTYPSREMGAANAKSRRDAVGQGQKIDASSGAQELTGAGSAAGILSRISRK